MNLLIEKLQNESKSNVFLNQLKEQDNYESIKDDYLNNLDFNIKVKGNLESIGVAKNIKEK